jgi:hypothetical protein
VQLDLIDYNNNEHSLVLDMVDMVLDDKVINIYDHIQVLIVFHMFVRMNVGLTMDQIEDQFLFDNSIHNVLVYLFDQIQFDILD